MVGKIAEKAAQKVAESGLFKGVMKKVGISSFLSKTGPGFFVSVLMMQGILDKASTASPKLQESMPGLHKTMKENDFDMLYFLAEDAIDSKMKTLKLMLVVQ